MEYDKTKFGWIAVKRLTNGITLQGAGKTKEEAENVLWTQYNKIYERKT